MRKILSIMLLGAALTMAAATPSNRVDIIINGDTTTVNETADTTLLASAQEVAATVDEAINGALDDTVYVEEGHENVNINESQVVREGMRLARIITFFTIAGISLVVFLCLLFYYLNRRRKYKMIEKAIENGYQLPPELLGGRAVQHQNIYVTPPAQPAQHMPQQPQQANAAAPAGVPQGIPVGQPLTQWQTYRGGIITSIVGFSLMLFFLAADATPMVALMSIILFIGLAKVFFTYQEQRNITTIYHNATQPRQPAPQQPVQPQPQQPAQPTPPPFKQEAPTQEQPQSPEQPS